MDTKQLFMDTGIQTDIRTRVCVETVRMSSLPYRPQPIKFGTPRHIQPSVVLHYTYRMEKRFVLYLQLSAVSRT